jgi:predicted ATPase
MARLDRLASVKDVAQIAAAIGREFSYELLAAVAGLPEAELQGALDRLVQLELAFRRGVSPNTSYIFKHALVRDAAYESFQLCAGGSSMPDRLGPQRLLSGSDRM